MLRLWMDNAVAQFDIYDTYATVIVKPFHDVCYPQMHFYDGKQYLLSHDVVVNVVNGKQEIIYDDQLYSETGTRYNNRPILRSATSGNMLQTVVNNNEFKGCEQYVVNPEDNVLNQFEAIFTVDYQQHKQPCVHPCESSTNTVKYGNHVMRIVIIYTPQIPEAVYLEFFDYEIYIDDKFITHLTDKLRSMYYDYTYTRDDLSLSIIWHNGIHVQHANDEFNVYHIKYNDVRVLHVPQLNILETPFNMFPIRDNYRRKVFAVDNIYPYIGHIIPNTEFLVIEEDDKPNRCTRGHLYDLSYFGSVCDMLIQHFVPNIKLRGVWNTYRNNVWYIRKHGLDFLTEMNMFYGFELSKYATCKYDVADTRYYYESDALLYDYELIDHFYI